MLTTEALVAEEVYGPPGAIYAPGLGDLAEGVPETINPLYVENLEQKVAGQKSAYELLAAPFKHEVIETYAYAFLPAYAIVEEEGARTFEGPERGKDIGAKIFSHMYAHTYWNPNARAEVWDPVKTIGIAHP